MDITNRGAEKCFRKSSKYLLSLPRLLSSSSHSLLTAVRWLVRSSGSRTIQIKHIHDILTRSGMLDFLLIREGQFWKDGVVSKEHDGFSEATAKSLMRVWQQHMLRVLQEFDVS